VEFRRLLRRWAKLNTGSDRDTDDVLVAVGKAVTYALQHGSAVRMRAWTADDVA
jgi:hypothetical protein